MIKLRTGNHSENRHAPRAMPCKWCGQMFDLRRNGGSRQEYCSDACRRSYRAGLIAFAEYQVSAGNVSVGQLVAALKGRRGRDG
jgi:hypothetical protein